MDDVRKNELFEKLGEEWRNVCLLTKEPLFCPKGKLRLPKMWMDALAMKDGTFYSMLPHDSITEVPAEELPPMSDRLRQICDKLCLPKWTTSSSKTDDSN